MPPARGVPCQAMFLSSETEVSDKGQGQMEQQVPATSQPGNASTGAKPSETLSPPGIRKRRAGCGKQGSNKLVSRPRNSARFMETAEPRYLLKGWSFRAGRVRQEPGACQKGGAPGRGSERSRWVTTLTSPLGLQSSQTHRCVCREAPE